MAGVVVANGEGEINGTGDSMQNREEGEWEELKNKREKQGLLRCVRFATESNGWQHRAFNPVDSPSCQIKHPGL